MEACEKIARSQKHVRVVASRRSSLGLKALSSRDLKDLASSQRLEQSGTKLQAQMRQGQEAVSESIFRMISRSPGVSWPSPRRFTGAALREATAKHCERCLQAKPSPVDSLSFSSGHRPEESHQGPRPSTGNPQLCCLPRLAHPRSLTSVLRA